MEVHQDLQHWDRLVGALMTLAFIQAKHSNLVSYYVEVFNSDLLYRYIMYFICIGE